MSASDYVDATGQTGNETGGDDFYLNNILSGTFVKSLTFYKNDDRIRAVTLTYTDDTRVTRGTPVAEWERIKFAPGERVTYFSMWDNGKRGGSLGLGKVAIRTDRKQELIFGADGGTVEYRQNLSSGLLAGALGRSGLDIDRFGLLFLKDISSVQISIDNDQFDGLVDTDACIERTTLNNEIYDNPQGGTTPWRFGDSRKMDIDRTFSQAAIAMWSGAATLKAGSLDLSVSTTASWSLSEQKTTPASIKDKVTISWEISGVMDPSNRQKQIEATQTAWRSLLDIDYVSLVTINFASGVGPMEYYEGGMLHNVQWVKGETSWDVRSYWPSPTAAAAADDDDDDDDGKA